jgi:large-conductance mechanosensitive channel
MEITALLILTLCIASYAMWVTPRAISIAEKMSEGKSNTQKLFIKVGLAVSSVIDIALITFVIFMVVGFLGV